jgi:hypothetical protein
MASTSIPDVLNSWKEIAGYLGRGVRTVQRYERELNLPVRRLSYKCRGSVLAFTKDLDVWLNQAAREQAPPIDLRISAEVLQAHRQAISRLESNLKALQGQILEGRRLRSSTESLWAGSVKQNGRRG